VTRGAPVLASVIFAFYHPGCGTLTVQPTVPPQQAQAHMRELWDPPDDIAVQDMKVGPWGSEHAPAADKPFHFAHVKTHGVSPGFTAKDDDGTEWSVKFGDEAHAEVVLSRVLSALGYHQPPVYYVGHFKLTDDKGTHDQPGARFRPKVKELKDLGEWSWQQNPFVGTTPYQGLLVILMVFDSSDLKNSNNTLYEYKPKGDDLQLWYVVRDLGTALGETARLDPKRNDPDIFERHKFISAVHDNGYVEFSYHGWHQELYKNRITAQDVQWACDLLGRLTDQQWTDAFETAGYEPPVAGRFIAAIKDRIDQGRHIGPQASSR
jgi:hypothetical protein